jgi:hypothetical protein
MIGGSNTSRKVVALLNMYDSEFQSSLPWMIESSLRQIHDGHHELVAADKRIEEIGPTGGDEVSPASML